MSGELSVSDPEAGQNLVAALTNQLGSYAAFSISPAGGWTYSAEANNQLTAGQVVSDVFSVSAIDGSASASAPISDPDNGDRIQLHGSANDYLLRQVQVRGKGVTAPYRNDGRGRGARAGVFGHLSET